jgi:hypothetical protein
MKEIEHMQITTILDTWRITMSLADVITDTAPYRWINIPQTTDPQDWSPLRPFPGKVYEGPRLRGRKKRPHIFGIFGRRSTHGFRVTIQFLG